MKNYNPSAIFDSFNLNNDTNKIYKNIHNPASTYVATNYARDFASDLLSAVNLFEKNSIQIGQIEMNEGTYNWMFRLFNTPIKKETSPLTSDIHNKYLYDYPINIVSNSTLKDGEILFKKWTDEEPTES